VLFRSAAMAELADAFVALPGGLGTLEELSEVASWAQLALHDKPIGLLDVDGYFEPLLAWLDHAVAEGFLAPAHRGMLVVEADADRLLDALAARRPPPDRWAAPATSAVDDEPRERPNPPDGGVGPGGSG